MYLGLDLGTSELKALLLAPDHRIVALARAPLAVERPAPLWSQQAPSQWWEALEAVMARLRRTHAPALSDVRAIGLSGQMHGAVAMDAQDRVLRPAILWNDGRSAAQCRTLAARLPRLGEIAGNLAMPGFTAPKLLWVARHEPRLFGRMRHVLLPKDWLRWRMTGEFASDLSDAAGTLWLDVARRDWSDELLAACGLSREHMPSLHEGPEFTGNLFSTVARRWGLRQIPVVAGASDNAAGALGVGVFRPGDAMLSLGTSGVVFVATSEFAANADRAVHSFCHALPHTWHLMSVMLSAASCLDFTASLVGEPDVEMLLAEAQARGLSKTTPLFLPYLNGERTPHNNPHAQAVFFGMHAGTDRADLVNATLEGVCHGLSQGIAALQATQADLSRVNLIGGGSRSGYWAQMLADATGLEVVRREDAAVGPALGAARLAWSACDGGISADVFRKPRALDAYRPRAGERALLSERAARFGALYESLAGQFAMR